MKSLAYTTLAVYRLQNDVLHTLTGGTTGESGGGATGSGSGSGSGEGEEIVMPEMPDDKKAMYFGPSI